MFDGFGLGVRERAWERRPHRGPKVKVSWGHAERGLFAPESTGGQERGGVRGQAGGGRREGSRAPG